jgi:flagellar hook-associated protein 3 FlgL
LQGQLSIAQDAALKAEIQALDAAIAGIVDQQAVLGINARKVDDYAIQAQTRADDLEVFVGDIEDVNMAEALTRLSNDRTALEASYKVTGELAKLSLLNFI